MNITSFSNINSAKEMINYFLENDDERYKIAEKNYKHFNKYHTIDIRIDKILEAVETI